jgi:hypothetical protein
MDETIRVNTADDTNPVLETGPAIDTNSISGSAALEPAPVSEELPLEDDSRAENSTDPDVANLVGQLGRLSFNLMALPLNLLPSQSRYHAKNSLREGFMAFKSLVDEVATGIDESIARTQRAAKPTKIIIEDTTAAPEKIQIINQDDVIGKGPV